MSTLINLKSNQAVNLAFSNEKMTIFLEDGREIGIPLEWFPRLREATKEQLENWRFVGNGEGIHWEELDQDLLVSELIS
ncbi:DUF2442 domain-containing protein [Algoriphagus boritolerans]|uniref:DUF2442 domain-containing protein n=1 Tax=Algoriphagus boritolerans DSM 17298 = JCM 18970 TaxID=1120964 RepID=A0A1H5RPJ2_9BACT|nr:DUF2442 domain-containing protein [Algoriphagus boritolerans]SEF40044.1 Protein of unknown function [Algoriphagus boritolerans DSM 17298 = JCM 18970]